MTDNKSGGLCLAALDGEDLEIISAHMQDAVMSVSDLAFKKRGGAFVALMNRYDWEADATAHERMRRRTALHFDRVLAVRSRGVDRDNADAVLNLLAIRFAPAGDGPSGIVELVFSGDVAIQLDVECIECRMKDLGPVWSASARPAHADEAFPAES